MLQNIRDRAQGWLSGVIVIVICIPFALWGINEYIDASANVVVAEVDGTELDLRQFQQAYQRQRLELQALFGPDVNQLDQDRLKQDVLERLVERALVQEVALDSGMSISDSQVAALIKSMQGFQRDGVFAQALYEQRLRATGMSPIAFEEQLRTDMLNEQLRQTVVASAFVSAKETSKIDRLRNQKRSIAYTIISHEPYESGIEVSDAEVEDYYQSHRDDYMTEEMVKVSYVELAVEDLAKQVVVDDKLLRDYYESHRSDYTVPEERTASHILVKVPKGASDDDVKTARATAEKFLGLARQGESLSEIAETHFDDAELEVEFGQTGSLQQGVMEPAFDEALFSMQPGELSEPVRTKFGFHVIQLDEIRAATTKSFEQARDEIEATYRRQKAEAQFFDYAEQLANITFETPDTLEPARDALDLEIKHSDYFSRSGGSGLMANQKVVAAAFSLEVLDEGVNSEPVELQDNRLVVLHLEEHRPARLRDLDEVRPSIVAAITKARAKEQTYQRGRDLLERLKAGEDRVSLAAAEQLEWKEAEEVGRLDPNVNRAILRTAFRLGRIQGGKPIYGGVAMGTGDYALVAVLGVKDPQDGSGEQKDQKQSRDTLLMQRRASAWRDFVAELKRHADIKLYTENF